MTAASNMSEDSYRLLCDKTREKFGADIEFTRVTDDSIIGGFILNIDGLIFDMSVSTGLREMKKHLKGE